MSKVTEHQACRQQQGGFALLLTVLTLILVGSALFLSATSTPEGVDMNRTQDRSAALATARSALLGYAVAGGDGSPGALPCPDLDGDGHSGEDSENDEDNASEGNISCQASKDVWLGRFPHATLGLSAGSDSKTSTIWYALDPAFLDWQTDVNAETTGGLSIVDDPDRYAAVLILSGDPLIPEGAETVQQRPSDSVLDYLEGENTDSDTTVFASCDTSTCNDRTIGITDTRLLAIVRKRALGEIRDALCAYEDADDPAAPWLPWAAELDDDSDAGYKCSTDTWQGVLPSPWGEVAAGENESETACEGDAYLPDWIPENGWNPYIFYKVAEGCRTSRQTCKNAPNEKLLSVDGEPGHAIVYGIPRDIESVDPDADAFTNPTVDGKVEDRFRGIAIPGDCSTSNATDDG